MTFVAEIAKEHEGNILVAQNLIKSANIAGCDAVKFQAYELDDLNKEHKNYHRYYEAHLDIQDLKVLKDLANRLQMDFWTSCFSPHMLSDLAEFTDIIKIPSTFFTQKEFVHTCCSLFDQVHISTGMHTAQEITELLPQYINYAKKNNSVVVPYHCVSLYPTPHALTRMPRINYLKEFSPVVGYSDHTDGMICCEMAHLMGCKFIEKHITTVPRSHSRPWCFTSNDRLNRFVDAPLTDQEKRNKDFYEQEYKWLR